jgi:DNA polymerase-3 subunit epsilon
MTKYAVLDLETTGLSPQDDRIVEIGILYINERGEEERYAGSLLNPLRAIEKTCVRRLTHSGRYKRIYPATKQV